MPTFKLMAEDGTWLDDVGLSGPDWKPGDQIHRGRDTLEVLEVREDEGMQVLVVRTKRG